MVLIKIITEVYRGSFYYKKNVWGSKKVRWIKNWIVSHFLQCNLHEKYDGPKRCPNNLPQPAWRLAELFFWSDMSWSRADLWANSYVISMHFSLLSKLSSCTRYISNVGIKTGLNSFQNFPYVTTFLLRSISVFYLWKTENDFGKNWVHQKQLFLDRAILKRDPSQKYWTSAISERMESEENFRITYYLNYLVKTLGPAQFWKEWSLTKKFGKLTIAFT